MLKPLIIVFMIIGIGAESFQTNLIELYYRLNTAAITQEYCVNKNKPQMHCNGQCHLAKELKKATQPATNSNKSFKTIDLFAYQHYPLHINHAFYTATSYFLYAATLNKGVTVPLFHPPAMRA